MKIEYDLEALFKERDKRYEELKKIDEDIVTIMKLQAFPVEIIVDGKIKE